ncbi:MAG: SCO family protein [Alphaproteobacteria bacterium]|nr:SCO family protein [Alphaproteobacteria bacterium]
MSKIASRYALPLAFLVAILLGFAFLLALPAPKDKEETLALGGPFTLVDGDGVTRTEADFKGQHLLIYFGYTFCPDICPLTLQTMSKAIEQLGEKAASVTPVFITVDPERDNVELIGPYVASFHPRFVGLTGTPEQVAQAAKAYRVYYAKSGEPPHYLVDHTSILFFMGPDGKFLRHFSHGATAENIAKGMAPFLKQ